MEKWEKWEKCLLCGKEMNLAMSPETSWWQCQNPFHRMNLVEYSDLRTGKMNKEQIVEAMKKREDGLYLQLQSVR